MKVKFGMNKFLIIVFLLLFISCNQKEKDYEPRFWIWMHGNVENTEEDWNKIFCKLNDTGIQGVLFGGGIDQLEKIISIAEKYKIDVHAWFWTMNRNDAKPEWLSVNRNGESLAEKKAYVDYYKFMCPAIPEVRAFIKDHIRKLSKVNGLKGIHMDYVRYVDVILPEAIQPNYDLVQDYEMPEFDYGYHPYMRKLYLDEYGIDPIEIKDPENDLQWKQFRYNKLNDAVFEIKEVTDSCNLILSAAVFPTPEIARKLVRQDWEKWPLQMAFPMIYHEFYYKDIDWIKEATMQGVNSLQPNQKLYTGLYIPFFRKPGELTLALEKAFEGGASGIAVFDYKSLKDYHWQELKQYIKYRY